MSISSLDDTSAPVSRNGGGHALGLAVILGAQAMLMIDATVVNVALPHIQTGLHFSSTGLSWVVNIYALAFGGLLLLGGRIGDAYGRRRVFLAGVVLFTLGSLVAGLATNAGLMLTGRAIQGIASALAGPAVLSLIATNFAEGAERNRALALFSAVSGTGGALGLLLGGMLTEWADWRWIFFVNLPIGALIIFAAPRVLAETEPVRGRFDLLGAFTATIGVTALVYAFIRIGSEGWSDGLAWVSLALAVLLLVGFVATESRVSQPVLPLGLLADRTRAAGFTLMMLLPATMFGIFYFLTLYLQEVHGYSPIQAGAAFLPLMFLVLSGAMVSSKVLPTIGLRPLAGVGALLVGAGVLWLTRLTPGTTFVGGLLGPELLCGLGIGFAMVVLNTAALTGVRPEQSGAASGLVQTMQQVGASIGLAILVTIFGTRTRHSHLASPHAVLTDGIATAFYGSVVFAVLAVVMAAVLLPGRRAAALTPAPSTGV